VLGFLAGTPVCLLIIAMLISVEVLDDWLILFWLLEDKIGD
jgi:hypothetical protein